MNDYATMSRIELLGLCKARGLSGAGTNEDLIERLQAQDAAAPPADQDEDPLADDETADAPAVEPEPADQPAEAAPATTAEPTPTAEPVGPERPKESAQPTGPDPAVKEGVTGNVFRFQFYAGRDIDDAMHRHFIAECHHNAHAAGLRTKGAPTVGHRVRFDADAAGKPTVVYEVYLARERTGGGQR